MLAIHIWTIHVGSDADLVRIVPTRQQAQQAIDAYEQLNLIAFTDEWNLIGGHRTGQKIATTRAAE